jgi:type II secretory pathway component PulM
MAMRIAPALLASWDAANASRRRLLALLGGVLLAGGLLVATLPLTAAIGRADADVARTRAMLEIARARAADSESLARVAPSLRAGDLRAAVDRVLAQQGVRATPVASGTADGRYAVVVADARFDSIVAAVDALARDESIHLAEATLTALVTPGSVRADLAFAR